MLKNKTRSSKLKPATIFLLTFCLVLIPGFIIWILIGEVDLLNVDFLISHNGAFWKGNINGDQDLVTWIINTYHPSTEPKITDSYVYIVNDGDMIINNALFVYSLIPLFIAITFPLFLLMFNLSYLTLLPFSISTGIGFFVFIICGLFPIRTDGLKYFLGLIIFFITSGIFFLIFNKIINAILSKTNIGFYTAIELQTDKKIMSKYEKDLKDIINNQSVKDNIEYIETDK